MIAVALGVEMFGYGFGFVGVILFIMQVVASGKYQTAHYALGTGFMQLGFVLFKLISGDIQQALGYRHFFLWVMVRRAARAGAVALHALRGRTTLKCAQRGRAMRNSCAGPTVK